MPALASLEQGSIDIASRTRTPTLPDGVSGRGFASYDAALRESEATVVYVSTRNHEHREHAEAALRSGRHVIIDKPAATSIADAHAIVALARREQRLVAEATVYPWHPQFNAVHALLAEHGPAQHLVATFTYPPLEAENFRYRADAHGGALWDLGPYAVTPGRVFFASRSQDVCAHALQRAGDEIDTAFAVTMRYSGNRTLVGQFSMTTAYVNRLDVLGASYALTLERAFTSAPNAPTRISGQIAGAQVQIDVPAADAFALFLADVFDAIARGELDRFEHMLLTDAETLGQLRTAAASASLRPASTQ